MRYLAKVLEDPCLKRLGARLIRDGVLIPTEVVGEVDKISSKFILCDHVCNSHDSLFYKALILRGEILC